MKETKLILSNDEAVSLVTSIEEAIRRADFMNTKNREKVLILAAIQEVHKRLSLKIYTFKHKYSITLTMVQSQGLWLAYEKGYLYSNHNYNALVLRKFCNQIHQITS